MFVQHAFNALNVPLKPAAIAVKVPAEPELIEFKIVQVCWKSLKIALQHAFNALNVPLKPAAI